MFSTHVDGDKGQGGKWTKRRKYSARKRAAISNWVIREEFTEKVTYEWKLGSRKELCQWRGPWGELPRERKENIQDLQEGISLKVQRSARRPIRLEWSEQEEGRTDAMTKGYRKGSRKPSMTTLTLTPGEGGLCAERWPDYSNVHSAAGLRTDKGTRPEAGNQFGSS